MESTEARWARSTVRPARQTAALGEVAGRSGTYGQGQRRGGTHTGRHVVQQPGEQAQPAWEVSGTAAQRDIRIQEPTADAEHQDRTGMPVRRCSYSSIEDVR